MIPIFDPMVTSLLFLIGSFIILAKSADFLVDGAVAIAEKMNVPKMIVGIVLVGLGTTAPEFAVSMISAISDKPEFALGNAVGSVIVDDAVALALGIIVAPKVLKVDSRILKSAGIFLICVDILAFILAINGVIGRFEGIILLMIMIAYFTFIVINEKKNRDKKHKKMLKEELEAHTHQGSIRAQVLRFCVGIIGVVFASDILVSSAQKIALHFNVPKTIIGMTILAIGTSLPEIATAIVAAKKGHGDLALGDIIGADILNILWIIGGASTISTITVAKREIFFMFPVMFFVVLTMLLFARMGYKLQKWKGWVLLAIYAVYFVATIVFFSPSA